MDFPIRPVPNFYAANAAAGAASAGESPAVTAMLMDKTKALEAELVAERTATAALHQQVHELKRIVDALGAPTVAATEAEAAAPAPAGGKRAAESSAAAGKRARRE